MSKQTVSPTHQTFRLRRGIQIQGIFGTLFFLTMAIAWVSVAFLNEPKESGFSGKYAVPFAIGIGVFFWGGWVVLGIHTLVAYYVERVTLAGSTVTIRSVFRSRQFDASQVVSLTWKPLGRLVFATANQRTNLDLYGFSDEDRLGMIRLFRGLISADRQTEWPMFCHKVAIPLRDQRLALKQNGPALRADIGNVVISRKRYDRLAAVMIAASVAAAFLTWWITASSAALPLPAILFCLWILLRFSVRPEGEVQPRFRRNPGGPTILVAVSFLVIAGIVSALVRFADYSREAGCIAALFILVPMFPAFIYSLLRAEKQQKCEAASAAVFAPQLWEHGERT